MNNAAVNKDYIHIDSDDEDRRVVVSTEKEDRFVMSCRRAAEACKLGNSRDVWLEELNSMLLYVREWARRNESLLEACYAAPREGQIVIFVVPRADHFDFDLSEKLTDLDLEVAEKFQACPCDLLQIPAKTPEALENFVNLKEAAHIYGDASRAPGKVGT